jgi:hypothetical protein
MWVRLAAKNVSARAISRYEARRAPRLSKRRRHLAHEQRQRPLGGLEGQVAEHEGAADAGRSRRLGANSRTARPTNPPSGSARVSSNPSPRPARSRGSSDNDRNAESTRDAWKKARQNPPATSRAFPSESRATVSCSTQTMRGSGPSCFAIELGVPRLFHTDRRFLGHPPLVGRCMAGGLRKRG